MAVILASRTVLDVVNSCLRSLGISAVNSIESSHPLVSDAVGTYRKALMEMQSDDWWFNRSYKFMALPNTDGEIELPINTISADPLLPGSRVTMVRQENVAKLYDEGTGSFVVPAQEIIIRKLLDFDQLPLSAQLYVEACTVLDFLDEQDGDEKKVNRWMQRRMKALVTMQEEDLANSDPNNFNSARQMFVRRHFARPGRARG